MKILKRIGISVLLIILFLLVFRGFVFRVVVKYEPISERKTYPITDDKLASAANFETSKTENADIDEIGRSQTNPDISEIIDQSLSVTSKHLNFTFDKNEVDPNRLIHTRNAHCVGYTSFFVSVCNRKLQLANLTTWKARPKVGKLYFFGTNVHRFFDSPFFKDHDFAILENCETGQKIAIDATLSDYFWIDSVSLKIP